MAGVEVIERGKAARRGVMRLPALVAASLLYCWIDCDVACGRGSEAQSPHGGTSAYPIPRSGVVVWVKEGELK